MTTATKPKSRGIIFTGESIPQIIAGTKTMTRRLVKPQPPADIVSLYCESSDKLERDDVWQYQIAEVDEDSGITFNAVHILGNGSCPYTVGMLLWVRETWALRTGNQADHHSRIFYKDGTSRLEYWQAGNHVPEKYGYSLDEKSLWRSPRYMPRWASRLTLEVTGVGIERVQEISEADIKAEGVTMPPSEIFPCVNAVNKLRRAFSYRWDSLNAKRGHSWESNPYVWVVAFKRRRKGKA